VTSPGHPRFPRPRNDRQGNISSPDGRVRVASRSRATEATFAPTEKAGHVDRRGRVDGAAIAELTSSLATPALGSPHGVTAHAFRYSTERATAREPSPTTPTGVFEESVVPSPG
jgi:hypothetical protein